MVIYQEAEIKIINTKLNKWKFATQNKTETMLRVNKKYFEDEKLPKEVFLTTRQTINTDPGGFFRVFVCLFVFFFFFWGLGLNEGDEDKIPPTPVLNSLEL